MTHQALDGILKRHNYSDANLLAILQDIQDEENWLPRETLENVAGRLDVPMTRVYRLATFFKSLSLEPRGRHICQVCIGTTCHVRGAPRLVDKIELEMKVKAGETTEDMLFTMETVGCVGACALGPLVVLDKQYHGNLTVEGLGKIIKKIKRDAGVGAVEADDEDKDED
jgi:NADH-quinone oxidoreductase subunit E